MNSPTDLSGHTHRTASGRLRHGLRHLLSSWPSAVGLLALLANVASGADPRITAMIIIIAATCYLGAAVLGSRRSGWLMVAVTSVAVVLASIAGLDATVSLIVMGVGLAVFGLIRWTGTRRRVIGVQALAFACYTAVALAAMMSGPWLAVYLAAAVAIGHTAWDVVHHVRNKVVSRSLAEACFVLDLGLAVALLAATLTVSP